MPEWTLHLVLFLPSLFLVGLRQSSMAAGLIAYLGCLFLYFLGKNARHPWRVEAKLLWRLSLAIGVFLGGIFFHGIIRYYLTPSFNLEKFSSGFAVFVCMLLCATGFSLKISELPTKVMSGWVERALWFMAFNALMGLAGIQIFPQTTHKPVGLFSEPSHFALVLAPLLAYACVVKIRFCRWMLGLFFAWGLAIQNLTTLLVVVLCVVLMAKLNWRIIFVPFIIALGLVFIDVDYFLSRLIISSDSDNQSVLVLLQGWESALMMIDRTSGWGGGFQQFGFMDAVGDIGDKIALSGEDGLNRFDGGSTASKIVGEFGFFGVLFLFLYVIQFFRLIPLLRNVELSFESGGGVFLKVCFLTFFIELFVRGVGYFSPTCFLVLAAMMRFTCVGRMLGGHR